VAGDGIKVLAGDQVKWIYTVTNTGNVALSNIVVTDNKPGVTPTLDAAQSTGEEDGVLNVGDVWVYSTTGTAVAGQYDNVGKATGSTTDDAGHTTTVTDIDESSYFAANPKINIDKVTGDGPGGALVDGDGLTIQAGTPILWTYTVTNIGNVALSNVVVTDNQAGVTPVLNAALSTGEEDGKLDLSDVWVYTASGTAIAGAYTNTGTAKGDYTDTAGHVAPTTDTDDSSYNGKPVETPPKITVDKVVDANCDKVFHEVEGVEAGKTSVVYQYTITNNSGATDPVTIDSVVDDKLGNLTNAAIAANGGQPIILDANESFTFTVKTTVDLGGSSYGGYGGYSYGGYSYNDCKDIPPYVNTVVVKGHDDEGTKVTDSDTATIVVEDKDPVITVDKKVDADGDKVFNDSEKVQEGTRDVTYQYTIKASSNNLTTDPVTVTYISDDKLGNLLAQAVAQNGGQPIVLDPGESFTFTVKTTLVLTESSSNGGYDCYGYGNSKDAYVNTVTVKAYDDEGTRASDSDTAKIYITPNQQILNGNISTYCTTNYVQPAILTVVMASNPIFAYAQVFAMGLKGDEGSFSANTGWDILDDKNYIVSFEHGGETSRQINLEKLSIEGVEVTKSGVDVLDGESGSSGKTAISGIINPNNGQVQSGELSTDGDGNNNSLTDPSSTKVNYLSGLEGNDTLTGGSGTDILNGGPDSSDSGTTDGADKLYGKDGNDILVWDAQDALLDGGSGTDILRIDDGAMAVLRAAAGSSFNGPLVNVSDLLTPVDLKAGLANQAAFDAKYESLEVILLTEEHQAEAVAPNNNGTAISLTAQDVLDITDQSGSNVKLYILGNSGDQVTLDNLGAGTFTNMGADSTGAFDIYQASFNGNTVKVLIEDDISNVVLV